MSSNFFKRLATANAVMMDVFRFRWQRSAYRPTFSGHYQHPTDAPVTLNVVEHIRHTLMEDETTVRFFLPVFAEKAWRIDDVIWQRDQRGGHELARYDLRRKRFLLSEDSAFVRLAIQYGVRLPDNLVSITNFHMRSFFKRLQEAVYAAVEQDPDFDTYPAYDPKRKADTAWLSREFLMDRFLRTSLFAQAYGCALTYPEYKRLYWFDTPCYNGAYAMSRREGLDYADNWDMQENAKRLANLMVFNRMLTGNIKDVEPFLSLQYSLLSDMYAVDEHDKRYLEARAKSLRFAR